MRVGCEGPLGMCLGRRQTGARSSAERCSAGYLLAGAPLKLWQQPLLGAELFDGGCWTTERVRAQFKQAFRRYEELGDPAPQRVPDRIETGPVGAPARFSVAGIPWELRLARVTAPGEGWFAWPPFLTASEHEDE